MNFSGRPTEKKYLKQGATMTAGNLRKMSRYVLNFMSYSRTHKHFSSNRLLIFENRCLYKYSSTSTQTFLNLAHCIKSKPSNEESRNRFNFLKATNINFNKKGRGKSPETKVTFALIAGILGFFQTKEEGEESELIMTIKRSVLLIQVTIKNINNMSHFIKKLKSYLVVK